MFFLEDGEKITREKNKFDAGFLLACAVLADRGLSEHEAHTRLEPIRRSALRIANLLYYEAKSACFGDIKATFDNAMRAIDCEIEKTDSLVKTTEVGYQFSTEMQEQRDKDNKEMEKLLDACDANKLKEHNECI